MSYIGDGDYPKTATVSSVSTDGGDNETYLTTLAYVDE
ncbi:hypothetical protein ZONE111905_18730 [Zobellia nedashkovskayae]